MVRTSVKRLYILIILISFREKKNKSRLNFTPKIGREKFDKIQPFDKEKKKGGRCFVQTPFPQLQTKFH